ncbi:MAG TPA: hypothetical protein VJI33_03655 [Candidatus Paceibacterota bacterium]
MSKNVEKLKKADKELEELGLVKIEGGEREMMQRLDCQWKRIPCGKLSCALCERIAQDRLRHELKGEDPDDIKFVMEDVGRSLSEALAIIKKDAERMGIDITNLNDYGEPPKPQTFLLYRKVSRWRNNVWKVINTAEKKDSSWLLTEAGADLIWYSNTVLIKTYRQLSNRWEIENKIEKNNFDLKYTGRVLRLVLSYLDNSLNDLSSLSDSNNESFLGLQKSLRRLAPEIMQI